VFAGQRCEVPSDCKDEYNPYCSKWGYCISYNAFGEEGPGQSKGAVEDGTRGQCRTDADCTPWAPSCSPLGYCRGGVQDGSFGSPTNPKAGGEQSDWIKKNAKSGGSRNEEYYGQIEDDNRKAHVKFRKDNPIFYEQIPVLLPRLEKIEKNVYEPCTYCKYDPKSDGEYQGLVERLSNAAAQSTGNNSHGQNNGRNANKRKGNTGRNRNQKRPSGQNTRNGKRPARKPGNNTNRRKNGNSGSRQGQQGSGKANARTKSGNRKSGGGGCPGGSAEKCMDSCPSDSAQLLGACVKVCSKRCM